MQTEKKKIQNEWDEYLIESELQFSSTNLKMKILFACRFKKGVSVISDPFGKRFLIMLFVLFWNKCEWKNVWKYV